MTVSSSSKAKGNLKVKAPVKKTAAKAKPKGKAKAAPKKSAENKPAKKPLSLWVRIQKNLSTEQFLPVAVLSKKLKVEAKFIASTLCHKEDIGLICKTKAKEEFEGCNKAFGYKLVQESA